MLKKLAPLIGFCFVVLVSTGLKAQERVAIPDSSELKRLQKEIRKENWYPSDTRSRLNNVSTVLLIIKEVNSEADADTQYAMLMEGIRLSELSLEPSLSFECTQMIASKFDVDDSFLLDWFDTAFRKYKSHPHIAEITNLFCELVQRNITPGKASEWKSVHKQLLKKVRQTKTPKFLESWEPKLTKASLILELKNRKESEFNNGLLALIQRRDIKTGLMLFARCDEESIAEAAKPVVAGQTNFRQFSLLLRQLVESGKPEQVLAARTLFASLVKNLSSEEVETGQRICFPMPPLKLSADFSLPVAGLDTSGYLAPEKSNTKNMRYIESENAWVTLSDFNLEYPSLPLVNYVHEVELEFKEATQSFAILYSSAEPARLRFRREDKNRSILSCAHTRSLYGIAWASGAKEYNPNQKISFRNYNIEGQQIRVQNGQYVSANHHGMEWPKLRFYGGRQSQIKITKFNFRPLLPGDKELLAVAVGNRFSETLGNLSKSRIGIRPTELAKYVNVNRQVSTKPRDGQPFLNKLELTMQPIAPGKFRREKTEISVSHSFWISKYETTQRQWCELMKKNPSTIQGNSYFPVDNVSYTEVGEFCKRLTNLESKAKNIPQGFVYRLPTEAEWEYVCRAGKDETANNNEFWNSSTTKGRYQPIGNGPANAFGVSEMYGNVEEWVLDKANRPSEKIKQAVDPVVIPTGKRNWIVTRGGTWSDGARRGQVNRRYERTQAGAHNRGFRVVLAPAL